MKEMLMGLLVVVIVYILIEIFKLVVYGLKTSKAELKQKLKETALAELERIVYNVVVSINQTLVKEFLISCIQLWVLVSVPANALYSGESTSFNIAFVHMPYVDINKDGIVDIFDLVLISKKM